MSTSITVLLLGMSSFLLACARKKEQEKNENNN